MPGNAAQSAGAPCGKHVQGRSASESGHVICTLDRRARVEHHSASRGGIACHAVRGEGSASGGSFSRASPVLLRERSCAGKTGRLLGVAVFSLHRFTHLVFQKFEQIPKCQLQKILRVFFVKRETLSENYSYVISFLRGLK